MPIASITDRKISPNKSIRLDGRTRAGKRFAELYAAFADAMGGSLTPLQRLDCERAALLTVIAEQAAEGYAKGSAFATADDVVRAQNAADRALRRLGLRQKPGRPALDLDAYLRRGASDAD